MHQLLKMALSNQGKLSEPDPLVATVSHQQMYYIFVLERHAKFIYIVHFINC